MKRIYNVENHPILMISFYPYLKIIRPVNCLLAGFSLIVGILITLGLKVLSDNILIFLLGTVIMILVSAGGFVINDIYDFEIDKINRPDRILPSQRISLTQGYVYTFLLFFTALLLSLYALTIETDLNMGLIPPVFTLFGIVTLYAYAAWLKKLGIFGNILVTGLSAISFILGGLLVDDISRGLFAILIILCLIYSREIIKDVEDVKGDLEGSDYMYSLPAIIGVRKTIVLAKIILLILILTTLTPFLILEFLYFRSYAVLVLGLGLDIISIKIIFMLQGSEEQLIQQSKPARKLLKIGALIGLIALSFNPFTQF